MGDFFESLQKGDIVEFYDGSHLMYEGKSSTNGRYMFTVCSEDEENTRAWCNIGGYDKDGIRENIKTNLSLENRISEFKSELNNLLKKYDLRFNAVVDQWNDIDVEIVDKNYNMFYYEKIKR